MYWAVLGGVNSYFSVYLPIFGMVTTKQPTEQPGDPSACLLLTSVRRQSFAISLGHKCPFDSAEAQVGKAGPKVGAENWVLFGFGNFLFDMS